MTPHTTRARPEQQTQNLVKTPNPFKETNVQIHHNGVAGGCNRFTSSYQSANYLHNDPGQLTKRATFLSKQRSGNIPPSQQLSGKGTPVQSSADLKQANFTLGGFKGMNKSQNQSTLMIHQLPDNMDENRKELKQRMQKTQFSFGNSNENLKGMKGAQSLYSTGIDAQAKVGGTPAQPSNLKQSNFVLGAMQGSNTSEAHEKFKSIRDDNARAQNKAQAF